VGERWGGEVGGRGEGVETYDRINEGTKCREQGKECTVLDESLHVEPIHWINRYT
jgi:hypothetical protein